MQCLCHTHARLFEDITSDNERLATNIKTLSITEHVQEKVDT